MKVSRYGVFWTNGQRVDRPVDLAAVLAGVFYASPTTQPVPSTGPLRTNLVAGQPSGTEDHSRGRGHDSKMFSYCTSEVKYRSHERTVVGLIYCLGSPHDLVSVEQIRRDPDTPVWMPFP